MSCESCGGAMDVSYLDEAERSVCEWCHSHPAPVASGARPRRVQGADALFWLVDSRRYGPISGAEALEVLRRRRHDPGELRDAVPPHSTDTTDIPWYPLVNASRLQGTGGQESYLGAFAWYDPNGADPDGDGLPDFPGDWALLHHEVSISGEPGAANVRACEAGIAQLGRTIAGLTADDVEGVYEHLASHLRDAGLEPAPLPRWPLLGRTAQSLVISRSRCH
jgi:hypothetical protein